MGDEKSIEQGLLVAADGSDTDGREGAAMLFRFAARHIITLKSENEELNACTALRDRAIDESDILPRR